MTLQPKHCIQFPLEHSTASNPTIDKAIEWLSPKARNLKKYYFKNFFFKCTFFFNTHRIKTVISMEQYTNYLNPTF